MAGYMVNIEKRTLSNNDFRHVLYTGRHMQLVVMSLKAGEEIGKEMHDKVDQFFRIEEGEAKFVFGEKDVHLAHEGDVVIVPAGTVHNVLNPSSNPLKLYTLYAPPNHPDGTVHRTKKEADEAEEHK